MSLAPNSPSVEGFYLEDGIVPHCGAFAFVKQLVLVRELVVRYVGTASDLPANISSGRYVVQTVGIVEVTDEDCVSGIVGERLTSEHWGGRGRWKGGDLC